MNRVSSSHRPLLGVAGTTSRSPVKGSAVGYGRLPLPMLALTSRRQENTPGGGLVQLATFL